MVTYSSPLKRIVYSILLLLICALAINTAVANLNAEKYTTPHRTFLFHLILRHHHPNVLLRQTNPNAKNQDRIPAWLGILVGYFMVLWCPIRFGNHLGKRHTLLCSLIPKHSPPLL